MSVLVTGGAGYIGSHMTLALLEQGENVCVLDSLSNGVRSLVPQDAHFFQGNINDQALVQWILADNDIESVFHFAGSTVVPESVENPLLYYENNTANTRSLLEACVRGGVKHFIFSSTAAVYGASDEAMIREDAVKSPASPYGRSKLMTEWMLQDTARVTPLQYVALRYFNVAGADPLGRTGQCTPAASHLIKRACQAALGRLSHVAIFGVDYDTRDGTGVRDYIHVSDLVAAHVLAFSHLRAGGASGVFNCGYGRGFSVREVIGAVEDAAGHPLPVRELPRRAGDSSTVIADPTRIKTVLGWTPKHDELAEIIRDALAWERRLDPA
ncbi:UDP-glucose 4-epimerase GalE [Phenylobacterium sp.]|uniref:UDP-glucose 4-epimerase GalE n=1 Tax=Phenylobacterium sp. TaxID=1871053 RepID=UPI002E36EE7C|nr:UDP-glucose 4-epimerase GalE [Phenylobacterium sp.]HEX4710774.1 UDP-glucose 4-epimerase GalE [Phenylobacterium sp.]